MANNNGLILAGLTPVGSTANNSKPLLPNGLTYVGGGSGSASNGKVNFGTTIKSSGGVDPFAAAIAALRGSQQQAQPKLPTFDYSGNMAKAQQTAASTVNPVYQDKLNQYLQKAQLALAQTQQAVSRRKEDISTSLTQALEDFLLTRGRTNEDSDMKIGDVNQTEGIFQRQEGRAFDKARTGLLDDVANAGLTESGIGQGVVADATVDRNIASDAQTEEFDDARRDTELFRSRTLADLDKEEVRTKGSAQRSTEQQDIDLQNFIANAGLDENEFRTKNEQERVATINNATQSAFQQILAQTIAGLAGSGRSPQDIALFKQVYG